MRFVKPCTGTCIRRVTKIFSSLSLLVSFVLHVLQWWFVYPDTFVPGRYFRIKEFSGLLNRRLVLTWKSVPTLFVRTSEISGLSEPGLTNHHYIKSQFSSCNYIAEVGCSSLHLHKFLQCKRFSLSKKVTLHWLYTSKVKVKLPPHPKFPDGRISVFFYRYSETFQMSTTMVIVFIIQLPSFLFFENLGRWRRLGWPTVWTELPRGIRRWRHEGRWILTERSGPVWRQV